MIENKLVITVECNRCGNQAETKTVAAVVVAAVVEELLADARRPDVGIFEKGE